MCAPALRPELPAKAVPLTNSVEFHSAIAPPWPPPLRAKEPPSTVTLLVSFA